MKLEKRYFEDGSRGLIERTKPYIGSNDQLDELNDQFAHAERAAHLDHDCFVNCQWCAFEIDMTTEADKPAPSPLFDFIADVVRNRNRV